MEGWVRDRLQSGREGGRLHAARPGCGPHPHGRWESLVPQWTNLVPSSGLSSTGGLSLAREGRGVWSPGQDKSADRSVPTFLQG